MKRLLICGLMVWGGSLWAEPKGSKVSRKAEKPPEKGPEQAAGVTMDEPQKLHAQGLKLMEAGKFEEARAALQKVIELAPGNAAALTNLGLIAQRQKDYPEASRCFKEILKAQPENGLAWLLLGIVMYEQDQLEAATAHLAQAVLYLPKNAQAHNYLGVTISRRGWYSGAEEQLRRAIELDPKYAEAHFNLASLYLERIPPSVELARRHYEKSVELGGSADATIAEKLK